MNPLGPKREFPKSKLPEVLVVWFLMVAISGYSLSLHTGWGNVAALLCCVVTVVYVYMSRYKGGW